MAKRNGASDVIGKFNELSTQTTNTQNKQDKQSKQDTQEKRKPGRPVGRKKETFRYNLALDKDLSNYLYNISWANHKSMTQYINDLIRKDMNNYYKKGGTEEGWADYSKAEK